MKIYYKYIRIIKKMKEIETKRYYLEDLYSRIELDLHNVEKTIGFVTVNCIVIVKGVLTNGKLKVSQILHPEIDTRDRIVSFYGD